MPCSSTDPRVGTHSGGWRWHLLGTLLWALRVCTSGVYSYLGTFWQAGLVHSSCSLGSRPVSFLSHHHFSSPSARTTSFSIHHHIHPSFFPPSLSLRSPHFRRLSPSSNVSFLVHRLVLRSFLVSVELLLSTCSKTADSQPAHASCEVLLDVQSPQNTKRTDNHHSKQESQGSCHPDPSSRNISIIIIWIRRKFSRKHTHHTQKPRQPDPRIGEYLSSLQTARTTFGEFVSHLPLIYCTLSSIASLCSIHSVDKLRYYAYVYTFTRKPHPQYLISRYLSISPSSQLSTSEDYSPTRLVIKIKLWDKSTSTPSRNFYWIASSKVKKILISNC